MPISRIMPSATESFSRFIESAELTLQSIKAAAQSAPQTRDFLLDINILRPICEMSHAKTHPRILRLCAQILSVLATGFDASSSSLSRKDLADCVLQSVRALAVYLRLYDVSLIKHSCQALAAIAADEEPFTNIQTIIDSGM